MNNLSKKDIIVLILQALILLMIVIFIYNKLTEPSNEIDKVIVDVYKNNSFEEGEEKFSFSYDLDISTGDEAMVLTLHEIEYNEISFLIEYRYVEESNIEERLDRQLLLLNNNVEAEIEIYKIKGISEDVAIAVKGKDSEMYYFFYNMDYSPKDINEFIQDFGIIDESKVLYVGFNVYNKDRYISYLDISTEYIIKNVLGKAGDKIGVYRRSELQTGLIILLEISSIEERFVISVLENGDLYFISSLENFVFAGGDNAVSRAVNLVNYISENYEGKISEINRNIK